MCLEFDDKQLTKQNSRESLLFQETINTNEIKQRGMEKRNTQEYCNGITFGDVLVYADTAVENQKERVCMAAVDHKYDDE